MLRTKQPPLSGMQRAYGYCRVSTPDQAESDLSLGTATSIRPNRVHRPIDSRNPRVFAGVRRTLTTLALAATTALAAPDAQASWYMANNNCVSIEQLYAISGWPGAVPAPHTPDEMINDMNSGGSGYHLVDVTAQYPRLNPDVARAIRVYPPGAINGGRINIWASNLGACYELRASFADTLVRTPHPSPFK
jgi:hypothetical protein